MLGLQISWSRCEGGFGNGVIDSVHPVSASPRGPDWWQASDLQWYPPTLQPGQPVASPPSAAGPPSDAQLVTAPTVMRTGERTRSQIVRNAIILLAVLVVAAGGLGWGFDALVDEVDLDGGGFTTERADVASCRIEHKTLRATIAAANATPEPDQWSDFLRNPADLRYWTVVGSEIVPIADIPSGCPGS